MGNPDPPAATLVSQDDKKRADLRAQRGSSKRLLTLVEQWVEATDTGRDIFDIDARLDMVSHYQQTFDPVQSQLEVMDKNEEAERDAFDTRVCAVKAKLKRARFFLGSQSEQGQSQEQFVDASAGTAAAVTPVNHYTATTSDLPLPKLKKFSGCDYLEYPIFINAFKALVDSRNLTKIRKFAILRDSVEGRAYEALQHLLLNDENYDAALKILDDRFMKKRLIFESLIKRVLEVPKASGADALRNLLDSVNASLKALEGLPATAEEIGFGLLTHLILAKVDTNTLNKWEEASCAKKDQLPKWSELSEFLDDRANMLESIAYLQAKKDDDKRSQHAKKSYLTSLPNCGSCSGTCSSLAQCNIFIEQSPRERYQFVKANHYCVRCLDKLPHDSSANCSDDRCSICRGQHNAMLHFDDQRPAVSSPELPPSTICEPKTTLNVSTTGPSSRTQVLGTAIIKIHSRRGEWVPARALLDGGSMVHFITKALASKLDLKLRKESAPVISVCGTLEVHESTALQLKSLTSSYKECLEAMVLPEFNHMHPATVLDRDDWDIPSNISLADPSFDKPQHVDMILGVALAYKLLMIGQIQLNDNLLLQRTHLGWVVVGEVSTNSNNPNKLSLITGTGSSREEKQHQAQWSPSDPFCDNRFRQHITRTLAGRFTERFPYINIPSDLGKSFQLARTRLMEFERKLAADSPIAKLKVAVNAAAPTSSGLALKYVLLRGPMIQPMMSCSLVHARHHQMALSLDARNAHRYTRIHADCRRFQCVLWRDVYADRLDTCQLIVLIYGIKSVPLLAAHRPQELASTESEPLASIATLEKIHDDNTLSEAPTLVRARHLFHEVALRGPNLMDNLYDVLRPASQYIACTIDCRPWTKVAPTCVINLPHRDDDHSNCSTLIHRYMPGITHPAEADSRDASSSALMKSNPSKTGPESLQYPGSEWHSLLGCKLTDDQLITSTQFMIGGSFMLLSDLSLVDAPTQLKLITTWQHIAKIQRHWFNRWRTKEGQHLHLRQMWHSASLNIRAIKIVFIVYKDMSPHAWTVARVIKRFPGPDGPFKVFKVIALPTSDDRNEHRSLTRALHELVTVPDDNDQKKWIEDQLQWGRDG